MHVIACYIYVIGVFLEMLEYYVNYQQTQQNKASGGVKIVKYF